jgi:fibronectin-binding autotransporter adhesin
VEGIMRASRILAVSLAAVVMIDGSRRAPAADVVWNVAGPADWNTAGNWNPPAHVPTGTDNAKFNNGGTANVTASTPTFTALYIASGGLGTGIVNVNSGATLSVSGDTAANQSIVVGNGGTNTAELDVNSSGVVNVINSGDMIIGKTSPGVLNQNIGNVNLFTGPGASSWLYVGGYVNAGTNNTGTYNLSGGSLSDPNRMEIAYLAGSTGTFSMGAAPTATIGQVDFGSGTGTIELLGGTLTVGTVDSGVGGTGVFNFNGGTLRPSASNASFMAGLATANVRNGGATIDTNGFNITIAQPLVHSTIGGDNSTDGGLTKNGAGTLTLTGASTYNGPTYVTGGTLLLPASGPGYFTTSGATFTVSGAGSTLGTTGSGPFNVFNNTSMSVTSGGLFMPSGSLNLGTFIGGALVIDGAGSSAILPPNATFTLGYSGLMGGPGTLSVSNDGNFAVGTGGTSNIAAGTININGGIVDLKTLTVNGGTFNFIAGSLSYLGGLTVDGNGLTINGAGGSSGLLMASTTIDATKSLTLSGTTTINQFRTLTLAGGTLSTDNLVNNGTFSFTSGTLDITGAGGLTIGSGGALGNSFELGSGRTLNVTNTTTVNPGALLVLDSGGIFNSGSLVNNGEVDLNGLTAVAGGGTVSNNGLIRGEGTVTAIVNNNSGGEIRAESGKRIKFTNGVGVNGGSINLQGGTAEFTAPLLIGSAGQINGQGNFIVPVGSNTGLGANQSSIFGLYDNGTIQLSGGNTNI